MTLDVAEYAEWHRLFDALCVVQGHLDNNALASQYCVLTRKKTENAYDSALKNISNWRYGLHTPSRRNFRVLGMMLEIDARPEILPRWHQLYDDAQRRKPQPDDGQTGPLQPGNGTPIPDTDHPAANGPLSPLSPVTPSAVSLPAAASTSISASVAGGDMAADNTGAHPMAPGDVGHSGLAPNTSRHIVGNRLRRWLSGWGWAVAFVALFVTVWFGSAHWGKGDGNYRLPHLDGVAPVIDMTGQQIYALEKVDLQVGQSVVVHGNRGTCGTPPPDWIETLKFLPQLTTGVWSDGGIGFRVSRSCGGPTPARAVVFTATRPGHDRFSLYDDLVDISVGENTAQPDGAGNGAANMSTGRTISAPAPAPASAPAAGQ